jgi:hypothetical protein
MDEEQLRELEAFRLTDELYTRLEGAIAAAKLSPGSKPAFRPTLRDKRSKTNIKQCFEVFEAYYEAGSWSKAYDAALSIEEQVEGAPPSISGPFAFSAAMDHFYHLAYAAATHTYIEDPLEPASYAAMAVVSKKLLRYEESLRWLDLAELARYPLSRHFQELQLHVSNLIKRRTYTIQAYKVPFCSLPLPFFSFLGLQF